MAALNNGAVAANATGSNAPHLLHDSAQVAQVDDELTVNCTNVAGNQTTVGATNCTDGKLSIYVVSLYL